VFADLDNDGLEEVLVTFGGTASGGHQEPDEVHRQVAEGDWERVAAAWGLDDTAVTRGVIAADLNRDGFLDVVRRQLAGVVYVDLARCDDSAWLSVQLSKPGDNANAIGAEVTIYAGDQVWWRAIEAGSTSFASSGPAEAHFGLGDLDAVDRIEVWWPDGSTQALQGVETRQWVRIQQAE
jgi:hypothetical protein